MATAYVRSTLAPPLFRLLSSSVGTWTFPVFLTALAVLGLVMSQRLNAVVDQHRRPEATRATASAPHLCPDPEAPQQAIPGWSWHRGRAIVELEARRAGGDPRAQSPARDPWRRDAAGPVMRLVNKLAARRVRRTGRQAIWASDLLVLHTVGHKSGEERTTPLASSCARRRLVRRRLRERSCGEPCLGT